MRMKTLFTLVAAGTAIGGGCALNAGYNALESLGIGFGTGASSAVLATVGYVLAHSLVEFSQQSKSKVARLNTLLAAAVFGAVSAVGGAWLGYDSLTKTFPPSAKLQPAVMQPKI